MLLARGHGDKEAMAVGGRLVKSVAVISIGQRAARPSRGLVWVLVWPEVEGRLCGARVVLWGPWGGI